jgi:hypothetical protein
MFSAICPVHCTCIIVLASGQDCSIGQRDLHYRLIPEELDADGHLGAADVDIFVIARGKVVDGFIWVQCHQHRGCICSVNSEDL